MGVGGKYILLEGQICFVVRTNMYISNLENIFVGKSTHVGREGDSADECCHSEEKTSFIFYQVLFLAALAALCLQGQGQGTFFPSWGNYPLQAKKHLILCKKKVSMTDQRKASFSKKTCPKNYSQKSVLKGVPKNAQKVFKICFP